MVRKMKTVFGIVAALSVCASVGNAKTVDRMFELSADPMGLNEAITCSGPDCVLGMYFDWGENRYETVDLLRTDGKPFVVHSLTLSVDNRGYAVSGASPNPWRADADSLPLPDFIALIDEYEEWGRAGGMPTGIETYVTGSFRGSEVFRKSVSVSEYSCVKSVDHACSGHETTDVDLKGEKRVDRLSLAIVMPDNLVVASYFGARPLSLQSNALHCYYGCSTAFTASNLNMSPVPLPAAGLLLGAALGAFGVVRTAKSRRRSAS